MSDKVISASVAIIIVLVLAGIAILFIFSAKEGAIPFIDQIDIIIADLIGV